MFRTKKTSKQFLPSFSNWPKLMKAALITAIALLIFQLLTDGLFLVSNLSSKTYQVDSFYWIGRLLISAATLWFSILGINRKINFLVVAVIYSSGNTLLRMPGPTDEAFVTYIEVLSVNLSVSGNIYITTFAGISISLLYVYWASWKLAKSMKK